MENTEIELLDNAEKLIPILETRLSRLKALVAAYGRDKTSMPQELHREVPSITITKPPQATVNLTPLLLPESDYSKIELPISGWIRLAIQLANGNTFTNPWILEKITELNKEVGERVASSRISTELFNLAKNEEIIAVRQTPGRPSEYQRTSNFQPVRRFRRTQSAINQASAM